MQKRLEECHILGQRKMKVLDANTSMLIQVAMYMMEKQLMVFESLFIKMMLLEQLKIARL